MPNVTSLYVIQSGLVYFYFRVFYTPEGKLIKVTNAYDNTLIYTEDNKH